MDCLVSQVFGLWCGICSLSRGRLSSFPQVWLDILWLMKQNFLSDLCSIAHVIHVHFTHTLSCEGTHECAGRPFPAISVPSASGSHSSCPWSQFAICGNVHPVGTVTLVLLKHLPRSRPPGTLQQGRVPPAPCPIFSQLPSMWHRNKTRLFLSLRLPVGWQCVPMWQGCGGRPFLLAQQNMWCHWLAQGVGLQLGPPRSWLGWNRCWDTGWPSVALHSS